MKTTIIIPDSLFRELKRHVAARGETLSAFVVDSLRKGLKEKNRPSKFAPLPVFNCGPARVDVAKRDELYRVMDQD